MAIRGRISGSIQAGGLTISKTITRDAGAAIPVEETLAAAKAGTLTTRTSGTAGSATLGSGHGITTGQVVDVYWDAGDTYAAGCRFGVVVGTVSGTTVPLTDSGAGDEYPADLEGEAITVGPQVNLNVAVDGDDVIMMAMGANKRCHADPQTSVPASIIADGINVPANETWEWVKDAGVDNPLTGEDLDHVAVSNGDSAASATFKLVVLYDPTP